MTSAYEKLPVPGYSTGPSYQPVEILASSVAGSYTKWGVTLAGGQGILPAGCVLARKSSDKKYYVYDNAGSGGVEVAVGVLCYTVDTGATGAPDQLANIYKRGVLKLSKISGADSPAIVDLNARLSSADDTFIF